MAVITGLDVMVGASFVFATLIEKDCVSVSFPSETTITTLFGPTWLLVGVQRIKPVAMSIVMPVGFVVKL